MKQTSLAAAIARYGHIDFSTGHWPEQGQWIKTLVLPPELCFPNWHVLNTTMPVTHIAANTDMHAPLLAALQAVKAQGLDVYLKSFDGCFNIRMVRGTTSSPSLHSYGLAIDLNAATNELGHTVGGFFDHLDFVKCFTDQGFNWGGDFHYRKDPMHFSYGWE